METVYGFILLVAVLGGATNAPFSLFVLASTEDEGWTEGDYEGSPEEQEEQAQEDWEDAGRPGDEEDGNDNEDEDEDQYEGLPTPEEAGETGVVDCGNGVFVEPREPCPEEEPEELGYQECENGELIPAGGDCPESNDVFAPDESCMFNVYQPKCIPPDGVDCPKGFGTNAVGHCFPLNEFGEWECPQGYHSVEDDETGQCYPDSQPCPVNSIMGGKGNCISKHWCEGANSIAECPDKDRDIEFNPPITPDLNCGDPGVPKNFKVQSGDPHDFDRDADGIGCEDNEFSGGNNNGNTKVIQKTTVINSASSSSSASSTAEVSSCRLDGSSDGILQKFDSAKYQACGLYVDGQKVYSDGFIIGCTQVGNTQLICQALVDSSILNMETQSAQLATQLLSTQATTQPTQQGIQPASK